MKCRVCSAVNTADAVFCTNCGASLSNPKPIVSCLYCRTPLEHGTAYCPNCGVPAFPQAQPPHRCPKCGTPHRADALFCDSCGILLASLLEPPVL